MKKFNYIFFILSLLNVSSFAQTSTQSIYIKGGESARENFMKEIYQYPAFESGIVEYRNGQRYKSNLNYNRALGRIQFIDEKGDTLALANEESITSVTIGTVVFLYNPSCLQSVKSEGKVKLLKNERVRIADKQKTGGYGIPNSSGSIESIDNVYANTGFKQLDINETLLLSKVTYFYVENDEKQPVPASKKNILKLFPKQATSIKEFIKAKNIDFSKENDLVALTGYLSQL